MRKEMKGEMEKMKEEMKKMNDKLIEEKKEREEERKKERTEWMRKKEILENRIATLEKTRKRNEKTNNNIVMKGMEWKKEGLEKEVEEYIRNMKVEVGVIKANKIRTQ